MKRFMSLKSDYFCWWNAERRGKMYSSTASWGGNESNSVNVWEERRHAERAWSAGGSPGPSVGCLPLWGTQLSRSWYGEKWGEPVVWTDPLYLLRGCGSQPEAFSAAQLQHIESVLPLFSIHPYLQWRQQHKPERLNCHLRPGLGKDLWLFALITLWPWRFLLFLRQGLSKHFKILPSPWSFCCLQCKHSTPS